MAQTDYLQDALDLLGACIESDGRCATHASVWAEGEPHCEWYIDARAAAPQTQAERDAMTFCGCCPGDADGAWPHCACHRESQAERDGEALTLLAEARVALEAILGYPAALDRAALRDFIARLPKAE